LLKLVIHFFATTALPDPETIRSTAQEVVRRPEFQIRPTHNGRVVWDMLWRLLEPIFRFFSGLWDISPVLAWLVIILLSLLGIVLIGHIVYTFRQAIARRTRLGDALGLGARRIDPIELEREAEDAAVRQEFIQAVRLLFRAALLRIAQREKRELRPGTTNREYLRRYDKSAFANPLQQFVEIIDAKWYGYGVCNAQDYHACRHAHTVICEANEVIHAHRA
jgi:hypothetical protein